MSDGRSAVAAESAQHPAEKAAAQNVQDGDATYPTVETANNSKAEVDAKQAEEIQKAIMEGKETVAEAVESSNTAEKVATDTNPEDANWDSENNDENGGYEKKRRYDDRKHHRRNNYSRGNMRNYSDFRDSKFRNPDFDNLPESNDPVEIRNQVEFYFSTQNLSTDWHLFEMMEGPKNLPVPIKHLHDFKRMRRFKPYSDVVAALRESEHLVVVGDSTFAATGQVTGNEAVKRKEPLLVPTSKNDEKYKPSLWSLFNRVRKQSQHKVETSIYAKDFGAEAQAGQIALENFFKQYGAVVVRKRRDNNNLWKGSVFVEFENEELQQEFLKQNPTPKYNGRNIIVMSKKAYIEMKCKEKGITPPWEKDHEADEGKHRGGYRGRGYRGRREQYSNRRGDRDRYRSRSPRGRRHYSSEDDEYGRDQYGDRSPREHRDNSSEDSQDWNSRRNKFQKSKEFRGGKRDRRNTDIPVDEDGIPILRDTTKEDDSISKSTKRKANDNEHYDGPLKKTKLVIKEDD
ncbi:hypothetical protein CC78DRAFT_615532 [Lojkania enalia]|uniref:Uncharacterized protein n=1 Tax=Lojkania enalia TaxID=147567 RepID=A0A9P4N8Q3_9PLEO|nr:hypothetical protein CC78DRAFT_615532 [Didymosphaeria enalia]